MKRSNFEKLRRLVAGELSDEESEALNKQLFSQESELNEFIDLSSESFSSILCSSLEDAAKTETDAHGGGADAPLTTGDPVHDYPTTHQARVELARTLIARDEADLKRELAGFAARSVTMDDFRGIPGDPLRPFLDELQRALCIEWNWKERRSDPSFTEPAALVAAIAEALVNYSIQVPFPYVHTAAYLFKIGMDEFCDCE